MAVFFWAFLAFMVVTPVIAAKSPQSDISRIQERAEALAEAMLSEPHLPNVNLLVGKSYYNLQQHAAAVHYLRQVPTDNRQYDEAQALISKIKDGKKQYQRTQSAVSIGGQSIKDSYLAHGWKVVEMDTKTRQTVNDAMLKDLQTNLTQSKGELTQYTEKRLKRMVESAYIFENDQKMVSAFPLLTTEFSVPQLSKIILGALSPYIHKGQKMVSVVWFNKQFEILELLYQVDSDNAQMVPKVWILNDKEYNPSALKPAEVGSIKQFIQNAL
jgi:hypothetical protein